jgi:hypothetical protein
MARRVTWTPGAIRDLEEVIEEEVDNGCADGWF